jgi:Leucine-rich repeat (LRR) protein
MVNNGIDLLAIPTDETKDQETSETIIIDPNATSLELTASRLRTIERLDGLNNIEMFSMRQNLIETIENLSHLITLKHVDLYDNHIERIEGLAELVQLKHVDLSFSKSIVAVECHH